jgi:hypothetical protein
MSIVSMIPRRVGDSNGDFNVLVSTTDTDEHISPCMYVHKELVFLLELRL